MMSTTTLNSAAYKWIATQVDSSKTRWALIAMVLLQGAANVLITGELIRLYRREMARPPYVVRVDNATGQATAILPSDLVFSPKELDIRFHLARWAKLYYSRIHGLTQTDQPEAMKFFHPRISGAISRQNYPEVSGFVKSPDAAETEIFFSGKNITYRLDQKPYRAEIHFTARTQSPQKVEISKKDWAVEVAFEFLDAVPKELELSNPLGFQIVHVRAVEGF